MNLTWSVGEFPIWQKEAGIYFSSLFILLLGHQVVLHLSVQGNGLDPVEGGGQGGWDEQEGQQQQQSHGTTATVQGVAFP